MNIIAVINEKGGVGKTTIAVNLAYGLARLRYPVLLIDMDPQSNATTAAGFNPDDFTTANIGDGLVVEDPELDHLIVETTQPNLHLIPASRTLRDAAHDLVAQGEPLERLSQGLARLDGRYQYVIIDLPPTIEILQEMAIEAADRFLIPVELARFSLDGLGKLVLHLTTRKPTETRWQFRVVLSRVEGYNKETNEQSTKHLRDLRRYILPTPIRYNGKIPLSQAASTDIYTFAPLSRGARDFRRLCKDIEKLWPTTTLRAS
jgi:chromosome partitioning protein